MLQRHLDLGGFKFCGVLLHRDLATCVDKLKDSVPKGLHVPTLQSVSFIATHRLRLKYFGRRIHKTSSRCVHAATACLDADFAVHAQRQWYTAEANCLIVYPFLLNLPASHNLIEPTLRLMAVQIGFSISSAWCGPVHLGPGWRGHARLLRRQGAPKLILGTATVAEPCRAVVALPRLRAMELAVCENIANGLRHLATFVLHDRLFFEDNASDDFVLFATLFLHFAHAAQSGHGAAAQPEASEHLRATNINILGVNALHLLHLLGVDVVPSTHCTPQVTHCCSGRRDGQLSVCIHGIYMDAIWRPNRTVNGNC
mmetsp:Transcript_7318/g.14022  ORF Transcript_7318/g.14022 Transcript_7318/m.14022 type:complete len:313 (-) Transcript_7318:627-1565(-)